MDQEERQRLENKYEGTLQRETKFLGSHPVIFIDEYINAVNDYACSGADEMEKFLNSEKTLVGQHEIVKEGVDNALKKLQDGIDTHLDKFELYLLANVFPFPKDIIDPRQQLGTVMAQPDRMVTQDEEDEIDQTLVDLRREAQGMLFMREKLFEEEQELDKYLSVVKAHKAEVDALRTINEIVDTSALTTTLNNAASKANTLVTAMKDDATLMDCENPQVDASGAPVGQVESMDGQLQRDFKTTGNAPIANIAQVSKALRV